MARNRDSRFGRVSVASGSLGVASVEGPVRAAFRFSLVALPSLGHPSSPVTRRSRSRMNGYQSEGWKAFLRLWGQRLRRRRILAQPSAARHRRIIRSVRRLDASEIQRPFQSLRVASICRACRRLELHPPTSAPPRLSYQCRAGKASLAGNLFEPSFLPSLGSRWLAQLVQRERIAWIYAGLKTVFVRGLSGLFCG